MEPRVYGYFFCICQKAYLDTEIIDSFLNLFVPLVSYFLTPYFGDCILYYSETGNGRTEELGQQDDERLYLERGGCDGTGSIAGRGHI